jgi:hypothetical protein
MDIVDRDWYVARGQRDGPTVGGVRMSGISIAAEPAAHGPQEGAAPPAPLDFEIVPRKGLIVVAIVFIAVIVAIASDKLWPLTFLHVAFGAAWTIIDLFVGLILGPILGRMSIPARIELTTKLMPKMLLIMPTVVTVALVAGWQLGNKLGFVFTGYPNHGWVVASYIVVGIMAIIALGLLEPANVAVLVELKKPRPRPEVIERLMKRFIYSAGIIGVLQISILVIMTKLASG